MTTETRPVLILGVIGADCHAVGNKILEKHFEQSGFQVINLGVMVSQDEFIATAKQHQADAILVSSLYGHAAQDCAGFRERCRQQGLQDVLLYIGGNLVVGKASFQEVAATYKNMGFNRVFPPSVELDEVDRILKEDLNTTDNEPLTTDE